MFGLAINLSIVVFLALGYLLVEALAMVLDAEPAEKYFYYVHRILAYQIAWSGLIALSLVWGKI